MHISCRVMKPKPSGVQNKSLNSSVALLTGWQKNHQLIEAGCLMLYMALSGMFYSLTEHFELWKWLMSTNPSTFSLFHFRLCVSSVKYLLDFPIRVSTSKCVDLVPASEQTGRKSSVWYQNGANNFIFYPRLRCKSRLLKTASQLLYFVWFHSQGTGQKLLGVLVQFFPFNGAEQSLFTTSFN